MEPGSLSSESPSSESLSIDVAVNAPLWSRPDTAKLTDSQWIEGQLAPVLEIEGIRAGELSIALVDDEQMAELNSRYRDKDGPTNVLSFPASGGLLGDIVLSYETLAREAEDKNISFGAHMSHLLIHGFLHLQGYDHQTETDAAAMEALEITALSKLGIDNPYEKQKMS